MTVFNPALPVLDEKTLLRELDHRVSKQFTSATNLVSVAAVRAEGSEAKAALTNVDELLHERERRANSAVASRRRRLPRPFKARPSVPRPPVPGRMPQITASTRSVVPVTQGI